MKGELLGSLKILKETCIKELLKPYTFLEMKVSLKKLDVIKLCGSKNHYRILFELEPDNTIIVYAILPREVAYQ
ncbi:MAG: hypothetical protein QXE05_12025 [Nitrososphaeria archaeon]